VIRPERNLATTVLAILALLVGLLAWWGWGGGARTPRTGTLASELTEGEFAATDLSLQGAPERAGAASLAALLEIIDRPALQQLERHFSAELADDPDNGELLSNLCEAQRLLGHFEEAADHGGRAVELLPGDGRAHHLYAKALGEQMRNGGVFTAIRLVGTYRDEMATAVALNPQNFRARAEQVAFLLYMPSIGGGDKEEAAQLADQLEQDDPRWGALVQALVCAENGDERGAVVICQRALEGFPADQKLVVTLGGFLEDVGRSAEAEQQYAAVLRGTRSEAYYLALYQQARLNIRRGQKLPASIASMEAFAAAAPYGEFIPPVPGAFYRIGSAWSQLNDREKARAAYGRALELDPDFERAQEALDKLGDG
jgi:tetratricopeptide (TPR) repeat protein